MTKMVDLKKFLEYPQKSKNLFSKIQFSKNPKAELSYENTNENRSHENSESFRSVNRPYHAADYHSRGRQTLYRLKS